MEVDSNYSTDSEARKTGGGGGGRDDDRMSKNSRVEIEKGLKQY